LVPADGRWRSSAGKVTVGPVESNGSLPPGDGLKSPAGWLPIHRNQLRAQRSETSMGELYLLPLRAMWSQFINVTDGQTDRQTDDMLIA